MRLLFLFFVFCATLTFGQSTAKTAAGAEMADILTSTKDYTLSLIEQMPEDQWDFQPDESVRSFRQQVEHIATVLDFQNTYVLRAFDFGGDVEKLRSAFGKVAARNSGKTIPEIKARLAENYDAAAQTCRNLSKKELKKSFHFFFFPEQPTKSLFTAMLAMRDHITHHRGQLILYLRLQGIEPIQYQAF